MRFRRSLSGLISCLGASLCLVAGTSLANEQGSSSQVIGSFGTLTRTLPIEVPNFRSLEPNLSLVYRSGGRDSWIGVGWGLQGLSFIERARPGGGTPLYSQSEPDSYFLDGVELINDTSLGGTYATYVQNYARITRDFANDTWEVRGTNGNIATFTPEYTTPLGTYRWMLKTVVDPHGNTVNYEYFDDAGQNVYLDKIRYNGVTIEFHRQSRPDPIKFSTGNTGFGSINYRLGAISVTLDAGSQLIRAYELGYSTSPTSNRSILTQFKHFDKNATVNPITASVSGISLPSTTMVYHHPSTQLTDASFSGLDGWGSDRRTWAADFDGDGHTDLASAEGAGVNIKKSTGVGFSTSHWSTGSFVIDQVDPRLIWLGDFNRDGKTDIAARESLTNIKVFLSQGTSFSAQDWNVTANWGPLDETWSGDFDGDDRPDIVTRTAPGNLRIFRSTGSGFTSEDWGVSPAWGAMDMVRVGDFNGDGFDDIASPNGSSLILHRSTQTGFSSSVLSCPDNWGLSSYTRAGDFNGDGILDLCSMHPSTSTVQMYLFSGAYSLDSPVYATAYSIGQEGYTWVGDFNGDGASDIVSLDNSELHYFLTKEHGQGFDSRFHTTLGLWGHRTYTRAGDYNGDGRTDIASPDGDFIRLYYSHYTVSVRFTFSQSH